MDKKTGIELIADERRRQVEVEGWTPEHDDEHGEGDIAAAASAYALFASLTPLRRESRRLHDEDGVPDMWPWALRWWKPGADDSNASRIRELVKAGALIAAEIDRLQRQEPQP